MGKRERNGGWIFVNADFISNEYVLYVEINIFALSGYEFRREWLQRKSTMGYAENITGNIRSKGEKC